MNTDHIDVPRVAHVVCGIVEPVPARVEDPGDEFPAGCPRDLWRTYGPAGSLWCPVHGHVLDVFPSPPLTGACT